MPARASSNGENAGPATTGSATTGGGTVSTTAGGGTASTTGSTQPEAAPWAAAAAPAAAAAEAPHSAAREASEPSALSATSGVMLEWLVACWAEAAIAPVELVQRAIATRPPASFLYTDADFIARLLYPQSLNQLWLFPAQS